MNANFKYLLAIVAVVVIGGRLTAQTIKDYTAYGKAYGIVRYFSPNPYTTNWDEEDWYKVCLYLFEKYDNSLLEGNKGESALQETFAVLSPNSVFSKEPINSTVISDDTGYYYWEHLGPGEVEIPKIATLLYPEFKDYKPFYKTLIKCSDSGEENTPQAGKLYPYCLNEGIYINIPIAERNETFSKTATNKLLKTAKNNWKKYQGKQAVINSLQNDVFWMSDIVFRWNIVQHFYPYHYEDDLNWEDQLYSMLVRISEFGCDAIDNDIYVRFFGRFEMMEELMNPVKDSHIFYSTDFKITSMVSSYISYWFSPYSFAYVAGNVVVDGVSPDNAEADIPIGSIIISINGMDIDDVLDSKCKLINSSNPHYARKKARFDIISSFFRDEVFDVEYITPEGGIEAKTVKLVSQDVYFPAVPTGEYITDMGEGIYYIDPLMKSAAKFPYYEEFAKNIETFQNAKGIIFDIRGYPAYEFDKILSHLITEPIGTDYIFLPFACFPNRENIRYEKEIEYIEPSQPYLNTPVVFLCDYNAISWAESVLILASDNKLGTIIGMNSCGTNGDATKINIPRFSFNMTAYKVEHSDGRQHHGIGVVPDIYVEPTLEGYMSGEDEILNAALDFLRTNISEQVLRDI